MTLPDSSSSTGRPEPVLNAAAVASVLTTIAGLVLLVLVLTHRLTPEGQATLGPALASAIPTVVGVAATLVAAFRARGKVTPLSDPISATGERLVARSLLGLGPAVPQVPGVADHAAPDEVVSEAERHRALNDPTE